MRFDCAKATEKIVQPLSILSTMPIAWLTLIHCRSAAAARPSGPLIQSAIFNLTTGSPPRYQTMGNAPKLASLALFQSFTPARVHARKLLKKIPKCITWPSGGEDSTKVAGTRGLIAEQHGKTYPSEYKILVEESRGTRILAESSGTEGCPESRSGQRDALGEIGVRTNHII
jgi:hypothetical protein